MRYPIAIEPGTETTAFGVVVPDLPGCFSAGDTLDEAISGAEEAAVAWIEAALDAGQKVPAPSTIGRWADSDEYSGWTFGVVKVDPAALDEHVDRVNISLPRRVIYLLDRQAREAGETRSGMIAKLALELA